MANALNRTLKAGEKVLIKRGVLSEEFDTPEWRTVRVVSGFGMETSTIGRALIVKFKNGDTIRVDAYDIKELPKHATHQG